MHALILTVMLTIATPATTAVAPPNGVAAIKAAMAKQEACWNNGNLECFMEGYWKSDSLVFIGKSGLKYGWQTTLDNYKRGYPDKATMGTLTFNIVSIERAGPKAYFVIGKWHLARKIGDVGGHYTLLWRYIDKQWVIVADHSS